MAEPLHDNVRRLMKTHKVKQIQLAKALGISPQAVNGWFKKGIYPSRKNMLALAELFNVSVDELTAETSIGAKPYNSIIRIDTYSGNPIPMRVLGRISVSRMAKQPSNSTEIADKVPVPFYVSPNADAFIMQDASMEPKVSSGDIIIIDPAVPYTPGKLIAARINSMDIEVFRKFVYDGPEHCALVPLTAGHRSYRFTHTEWDQDVEVLGTYVGHIHRDA